MTEKRNRWFERPKLMGRVSTVLASVNLCLVCVGVLTGWPKGLTDLFVLNALLFIGLMIFWWLVRQGERVVEERKSSHDL